MALLSCSEYLHFSMMFSSTTILLQLLLCYRLSHAFSLPASLQIQFPYSPILHYHPLGVLNSWSVLLILGQLTLQPKSSLMLTEVSAIPVPEILGTRMQQIRKSIQ